MDGRYKVILTFVYFLLVTALSTPAPQPTTLSPSSSTPNGVNTSNSSSNINNTSDELVPVFLAQGEFDLVIITLPDIFNLTGDDNSTTQGSNSTSLKHLFKRDLEYYEDKPDNDDISSLHKEIRSTLNTTNSNNSVPSPSIGPLLSVNLPINHKRRRSVEIREQQNVPNVRPLVLSQGKSTEPQRSTTESLFISPHESSEETLEYDKNENSPHRIGLAWQNSAAEHSQSKRLANIIGLTPPEPEHLTAETNTRPTDHHILPLFPSKHVNSSSSPTQNFHIGTPQTTHVDGTDPNRADTSRPIYYR